MSIRLHDSLTRQLTELKPSHPDGVFRFYNCGPTVYAPAHIGNFRTFVVNDVLRRLFELEFGPDKVKHVRNLTDVDDKTIKRARDEGRPLAEVTKQWTDKFHADCAALNCLTPHVEPTATGHIQEQVDMIEVLLRKRHAYRAPDGSVYFRVSSFHEYGELSRLHERELKTGSALAGKPQTVDADEKEDGSDFALWKAWKPEDGDVKWPGPDAAAAGRPGWHIECSAMSKKHLGDNIDLHSGGVDLLFPHHENEIAQSECCNGVTFANHWYHSEHLLVDGKKMSKSLGNLYTLDDLKARGFSPMALRYALLAGHPRKQLNFTLDGLHAAESALEKLRKTIRAILVYGATDEAGFETYWDKYRQSHPTIAGQWGIAGEAWDAITRDDLNIPLALGFLFKDLERLDTNTKGSYKFEAELANLSQLMFALGLKLFGTETRVVSVPAEITALAAKRWAAKQAKDFAAADALRQELTAAGWSMLDAKDTYKLQPLKK